MRHILFAGHGVSGQIALIIHSPFGKGGFVCVAGGVFIATEQWSQLL